MQTPPQNAPPQTQPQPALPPAVAAAAADIPDGDLREQFVAAMNAEIRVGMDAHAVYIGRLARFIDGEPAALDGPAPPHVAEDGGWDVQTVEGRAVDPRATPPVLISLPTFCWADYPRGHMVLNGRTSDRSAGYAMLLAAQVFAARGFRPVVGYGVAGVKPGTINLKGGPDSYDNNSGLWEYYLTATPATDAARECYGRLVAWARARQT
jgi:hypothetical protein